MGAFFTNVQVRSDRSAEDALAVLKAHLLARGMRELAAGEEADRTILVERGGGWISVYDEESEGQSTDVLGDVASVLSRELAAHAVCVLVHDSDVLLLELWNRGERVDAYDSAPEYFGPRSKKDKAAVAGRPELWKDVLAKDATVSALADAWTGRPLFAEATLAATAALLGIPSERASIGYSYADKHDAKYARLALRKVKRPAAEMPASGTTRFALHAHNLELEASQNMSVQMSMSARNEGGSSRGLDVVVSGDAVARGLVDVASMQLVVGVPRNGLVLDRQPERRDGAFIASFDDVAIPAGNAGGLQGLAGLSPQKMVDAMYASVVHVNVYATGGKPGEGELVIAFVPHENRAGALEHAMKLRVTRTPRRPLRARADVDAHTLRPLESGRYLVAQVSLDLDRAAPADVVTPMFARLAPWLAGELTLVTFPGGAERPRTGQAKANGFFSSRRWTSLRKDLATARVVEVSAKTAGFAFGTHIIGHDVPDPELPTISMWVETTAAEAQARLEGAVDVLMERHRGVQAIVTRFGALAQLDSNPYEIACGVHGQCTLHRSWLVRWLRAVGPGVVWLGKELASHVDRAALERVATIREHEGALRVTVDESKLDDVERALAPILPSTDDWRRGIDALYGR